MIADDPSHSRPGTTRRCARPLRSCARDPACRIQKVLEGADIKLASVVSDVGGASGLAMLEALVAGEEDPEVLAGLARGRLCAKHPQLVEALRGTLGRHQPELLALQRAHLTALDRLVEEV